MDPSSRDGLWTQILARSESGATAEKWGTLPKKEEK